MLTPRLPKAKGVKPGSAVKTAPFHSATSLGSVAIILGAYTWPEMEHITERSEQV